MPLTHLALAGVLAVTAPAQQAVAGLDIWYVDEVGRAIHRVDHTNGVEIANFAIPGNVVTPAGLAVTGSPGGARALWLLDSTTDQIWRLSPLDGRVLNIVPTPTFNSIGIGSGFIVPGTDDEEVFVVDANGLVFWISPTTGDVLHTCDLGVTGIRDAAAFPLGSHGTGLCILRDINPGGCEIRCFNKLSCRLVMTHTYPWEGWGLGNRTVGTTAGTATELYASDLNANVLHVLRASDGFELRTIPTVVNGADIRGVGGDCMSPPQSTDLCPRPGSFSTAFAGNIFLGTPSLDPGACFYFDLDVAAGITITELGLDFLNDGTTHGSITVPNLIGTPAGVQVWVVDISAGQNGGTIAANLPRTYTINPLVLPAAPWNPAGPDATGTLVVADIGQPSLTASLSPLHLAAGSYGVCIVMVPNGTSTSPPATAGPSSRLHPVVALSGVTAIGDQICTLMPRGLSSSAFGIPTGQLVTPELLVSYTLDSGAAYSASYGTGCYDFGAPSLAAVARPRHGTTLQLRCGNLDPATLAVLTFLSLAPIPNGIDLAGLGMPGCATHIVGPWLAEGLDLSLGAPSIVATFGTIPPLGPLDVHAVAAALSVASPPWNSLNVLLSPGLCLHVDAN